MSELFKTDNGVSLVEVGGIGVLSFLSKVNCGSQIVLDGVREAIRISEEKLKGLIIWQPNEKFFCVGADLPYVCDRVIKEDVEGIRYYLSSFQQTALACRYSRVPVISAIRGYALGGGCEIALHSHGIVADDHAKIGLVESAIGLLPSGGGTKEMILRASHASDYAAHLKKYFLQLASGLISRDAAEAKQLCYMQQSDVITASDQVLDQAKALIQNLDYVVPDKPEIKRLGKDYHALFLDAYHQAHAQASEYDVHIMNEILNVFLADDVSGDVLSEQALLDAELDAFILLAMHPKTQARIKYTLKTGQHLHN